VQEASLDILEHLLVVDGTPDPVLTAQCLDELAQLRPPRAQLAAISKRLEKALAKRDDAAAQEATRQLVRANRERLLEAVEEERAATQPSTKR
jgi:DNA-binding GntR family transcriptional regulator